MKCFYTSILIILALTPLVSGQVDTLALNEIRSFPVADSIVGLLFANLQDDSTKEIVVSSLNHVSVYDSQTGNQIWQSPDLIRPTNISFPDLNNDGDLDLAVKDSLNLFVFDIADSLLLWSCPLPGNTYCCYTINDGNNDGFSDIIIVRKEPFTRSELPSNLDTVWVSLYNGPDFQNPSEFILQLSNYNYVDMGGHAHSRTEKPNGVFYLQLSSGDSLTTSIALFTAIHTYSYSGGGNYGTADYGNGRIINVQNQNIITMGDIGELLSAICIQTEQNTLLYELSRNYTYSAGPGGSLGVYRKFVNSISADAVIESTSFWQHNNMDWSGFLIGEINENHSGYELTFQVNDTLRQISFPNHFTLWRINRNSTTNNIFKLYHNPRFFNGTQVMLGNPDRTMRGINGDLSSVFISQGIGLADINDLDNDGEDEFISYNHNIIHIYHPELSSMSIEDDNLGLPMGYHLYSNYPNPLNPATTIKYDLPLPCRVKIDIYDILGRRVATLADEEQVAGSHNVIWNASDKSSGIYFYRIQAGEFVETKKMLLVR